MADAVHIGEAAKQVSISVDTIRFYGAKQAISQLVGT
jgi:DNA-binding transcriptional MerR regulator